MPEFKDRIYDTPDGKPIFNIKDKDGNIVVENVSLELACNLLQDGDEFKSREVNLLLRKTNSGDSEIDIDAGTTSDKRGSVKTYGQESNEAAGPPIVLPHRESFIDNNGRLYGGDVSDKPVPAALQSDVAQLSQEVSTGRAPTNHASTTTQYGKGNNSEYGHLKLINATNQNYGINDGFAATPYAVKLAYDLAEKGGILDYSIQSYDAGYIKFISGHCIQWGKINMPTLQLSDSNKESNARQTINFYIPYRASTPPWTSISLMDYYYTGTLASNAYGGGCEFISGHEALTNANMIIRIVAYRNRDYSGLSFGVESSFYWLAIGICDV